MIKKRQQIIIKTINIEQTYRFLVKLFFRWYPLWLKLLERYPKLDCFLKMQLLTHSPLTQGCLPHTLNESFSQLPDQEDLLILKTHFLSQDWIHKKHKYFLFDDLNKLQFIHTSISVECMSWVEMKGRKRRFYRWENGKCNHITYM